MRATRTGSALLAIVLSGVTAACAAPERGKEYVAAYAAGEAAIDTGKFAEAAARFDEAARTAQVKRDGEHARYLAARALASAGDNAEAATRLRAIADASPPLEDSPTAAYAICEAQIARGDEAGWAGLLDVARRFPSSGVARPALRRLIAHEDDARGPGPTLAYIEKLAPSFESTDLAETLAYERALHLTALGQDIRARDAFVAMAKRWPYPQGVFWDDALYRASVLDEKLGDYPNAALRLTEMLAARESSWLVGSYERPRYEAAIVRLCALTRDRYRDHPRARACFDALYRTFTTSELRDDALWEEARLYREDGDKPSACERLATLVSEFPDSRFVPCAMAECPGLTRPGKSGAPLACHSYIARIKLGSDETASPTASSAPGPTLASPVPGPGESN